MAVNVTDPAELRGASVVGSDGDKLGKVDEVYLDNETGNPEWAAVKTGMFGGNVSLVPLAAADWRGEELSVPFDKDRVKNAPHHDPGREISADDERELFSYYDVPYGGETVTATGDTDDRQTESVETGTVETGTVQTESRDRDTGTVGHDTSGPDTDDAITRSEERLHVGTERRETGRARLRKFITTETVERTVPVSREEVHVEREPITDTNRGDAMSGGELTEEEHEVTLHEERPVVEKETVPVERIRLDKETVTDEQSVSAEVRKENVELDDDVRSTRDR